jgi:hypothetical protein
MSNFVFFHFVGHVIGVKSGTRTQSCIMLVRFQHEKMIRLQFWLRPLLFGPHSKKIYKNYIKFWTFYYVG